MSILNITARPEAYEFSAIEEKELRKLLDAHNRDTIVSPIGTVQDLLINPDTGQTTAGYTYSDVALGQICSLLSAGLYTLINDVCGQQRKPGEDKRFFSGAHAVEIFNRVVKLRFARTLIERQLVIDSKRKTIDGIVGARYRYLSNVDFFSRVADMFAGTKIKFTSAGLYGRQFFARFVYEENTNMGYDCCGDKYIPGFHFTNAEIGGRSVRTAAMLVKSGTDYCAMGPFREAFGDRVVHSGSQFERRLHTLFSTIQNRLPSIALIEGAAAQRQSKSLHFDKDYEKNFKHLVTVLRRRRLTVPFARRAIASAAAKGRYDNDSLADRMPDERELILGSRTQYDLFVALIREARQLPLEYREVVEQSAYGLLVGTINI